MRPKIFSHKSYGGGAKSRRFLCAGIAFLRFDKLTFDKYYHPGG
jgi:hypothetical protein